MPGRPVRLTSVSRSARSQIESALARTSARVAGSMNAPPPSARTCRSLAEQARDHPPLLVAERRLADLGEDVGDGGAGGFLDRRVGVLERPAQDFGETPAHGGLAGAHHADQDHGAVDRRALEGGPAVPSAMPFRRLVIRTLDRTLKLRHASAYKAAIPARGKPFAGAQTRTALRPMSTINRFLIVLLLVLVLGGTVFLVTWEIPPPTARVERVLPDDTFPR